MDQAKYCWPRDACLSSKEFAKFIKPRLTVTALIAHGHDVVLGLSLPGLSQDSSRTVELLARTLERFRERGQDLRGAELVLQGDNGPKEIKNNSVVRYLAQLVALGKLRRAEVRTLMVGHTHEDVDLLFSNLTKLMVQGGHRLHTPWDFKHVLQSYLTRGDVRPHESNCEVALFNQVRDWTLSSRMVEGFLGWMANYELGRFVCVCLRKTFLAVQAKGNTITGIGGPGAPHLFALDRIGDLGGVEGSGRNTHPVLGLRHDDINTKFWRRRRATFGPHDVVLRKGW